MKLTEPLRLSAMVAAAVMVLAACGDDAGSDNVRSDDDAVAAETQTVVIGMIPTSALAPLWVGEDQGFFEEEGIEIETREFGSGAEMVPATISGEIAMGYTNPLTLLNAAARGLPVQIVVPVDRGGTSPEDDPNAIVASPESGITTLTDLEGKTVAVQGLGTINDVMTREAIDRAGGDVSAVNFVEVPWPNQPLALENGQIDAAAITEPFLTQSLEQGAVQVANPFTELLPEQTLTGLFASQEWLDENEDLADGFVRAWAKSVEYAMDNREEAREVAAENTGTDLAVLQQVKSPGWTPDINLESLSLQAELGIKWDIFTEAPEASTIVYRNAQTGG